MYRTIDGAFWTDPGVKKLSTAHKLLFLYFITNPAARISGLYCVAMPTICHETKMTEKQIRLGIETLAGGNFIEYDDDCEVVWVCNMLRHQAGNKGISPKIAVAVAKDLEKAHNSSLIKKFMVYYDTLSIPYIYPTDRGAHSEDRRPKTEDESGESADAALPTSPASTIPTPFTSLTDQWNTICGSNGCPKVKTITEARKAKMRIRWKEDGFRESYGKALNVIAASEFLRGDNNRGWLATFDWLISNGENWVKVVEGNYDGADTAKNDDEFTKPFETRGMTDEELALDRAAFDALPDAERLPLLLREVGHLVNEDDRVRAQAEIDRIREKAG